MYKERTTGRYFDEVSAPLTQWTSPQTLEAGAMSGAFFEIFVISEIAGYRIICAFPAKNAAIFYFSPRNVRGMGAGYLICVYILGIKSITSTALTRKIRGRQEITPQYQCFFFQTTI